jgi:hypothetical protein
MSSTEAPITDAGGFHQIATAEQPCMAVNAVNEVSKEAGMHSLILLKNSC